MAMGEKRGSAPAEAFITDGSSIVVAHPMGPHSAQLGLDRPAALLGGNDRLAPNGMSSALGIDHVAGLRNFVAAACERQSIAGETGINIHRWRCSEGAAWVRAWSRVGSLGMPASRCSVCHQPN